MKIFGRFIVTFICLFTLHETVYADGAALYDVNNLIDRAGETKLLNEAEKRSVEMFRKNPDRFRSSTVTTLNRSSFASSLIKVVMPPGGKQYNFTGQQRYVEGTKDTVWSGTDKNGASLVIADDPHGTSGVLHDANLTYQIYALPGKRFYVIVENVPHPMQEPTSDGSAGFLTGK